MKLPLRFFRRCWARMFAAPTQPLGITSRAFMLLWWAGQQPGVDDTSLVWVGPPSFRYAIYKSGVYAQEWLTDGWPVALDTDIARDYTEFRLGGIKAVVQPNLREGTAFLLLNKPFGEFPMHVISKFDYDVPPSYIAAVAATSAK